VGIGPTLFGYLVQCGIVQSEWLVAMESFVASVETFTQKKIKTPPSWILAKSENHKSEPLMVWKRPPNFKSIGQTVLKVSQFQKSKMAAGLPPPSWIFFIIWKLRVIALVGTKLATEFWKDRSSGLKVIAISKILTGQCCNRPKF
jgi:hypothetical protein